MLRQGFCVKTLGFVLRSGFYVKAGFCVKARALC